jgi:hypothetical protein
LAKIIFLTWLYIKNEIFVGKSKGSWIAYTSSPLTIQRDKQTLVSTSHEGPYPCGEGAGYAGGITSAAVDGVRCALSILKREGLIL